MNSRLQNTGPKSGISFPPAIWKRLCLILIILGSLARFYDLQAPWKRKDHYNYGGVHTTWMARCMQTTPLEISKGVPHVVCENGRMSQVYPNHPPTILFALDGWWALWGGESEAATRSFVILFSLLNILLVFRITRRLTDHPLIPWTAAALQSLTVGGLYFGSHPDFICEFAVFFVLLACSFALSGRAHLAGLVGLLGGLASWPGFLFFPGWLLFQRWKGRKIWPVFLWGPLAAISGLLLMMWLHQTPDLISFLKLKLLNPGYVRHGDRGLLYPLRWLYQALQYQNNLLGPLFFFWLLLMLRTKLPDFWRNPERRAEVALLAGTGIVYTLLGHEYVYIHAFLYLYWIPAIVIGIAFWLWSSIENAPTREFFQTRKAWIAGLAFWVVATYTYGRYKSNIFHDAVNSLGMIGVTLTCAVWMWRNSLSSRRWMGLLAAAGVLNISQMINYRNEPALDAEFCTQARAEYARTGQPVASPLDDYFTRHFYCAGIPLTEPAGEPDESGKGP